MDSKASNDGVRGACFAVLLLFFACGGRANDDDVTGEPTCSQVCRHVIETCTPGGEIDACVKDCDKMRTDFMGCAALDPFMRCSVTARVVCTGMAVIEGCSEERTALTNCTAQ